ncbi:GntR family transcriptional regulator [Pseudoalteromonas xiamenensis]
MLLYQQIRHHLQERLATGELQPGCKLPSERTLQDQFNSTRITVREALARLEAEGLIYSQKRRGWFVTPEKLKWNPAKKVNFNLLAQEQEFTPQTRIVSLNTLLDNTICPELGNGALYCLSRVRSLNERAIMFEAIHCAKARFVDLEKQRLDGSITEVMANVYAVEISHETCQISVTVLPDDVAEVLEKNNGAPCLKITRSRYSADNDLIDFNIEYWLHDAIEMIVEGH